MKLILLTLLLPIIQSNSLPTDCDLDVVWSANVYLQEIIEPEDRHTKTYTCEDLGSAEDFTDEYYLELESRGAL